LEVEAMNWPPLTPECSQAVADVLKDVAQQRPKDLFGFVIAEFEKKSTLDPSEFEAHFLECKRQSRTYVLEDRCPANEDPMVWVPMRYNDDTVLKQQKLAHELWMDVLSVEELPTGKELFDRALVAYPELNYLRDSPAEATAAQVVRGLCLCCSGCPTALETSLEDDSNVLTFWCKGLLMGTKTSLLEPLALSQEDPSAKIEGIEGILLFVVLRLLGGHEAFCRYYGLSPEDPSAAAVAILTHTPEAMPSVKRLPASSRTLLLASLRAYLPFHMILGSEMIPWHMLELKESLVPCQGLLFLLTALAVEYTASQRLVQVAPEIADVVRIVSASAPSIEKHSASRAYELYLRRRAECHQWRLVRDDFRHRAVIRLCCMAGTETKAWEEIKKGVEGLPEAARGRIENELGLKDGVTSMPAFVLDGASQFMMQVGSNPHLDYQSGVHLLARVLEELAGKYDETAVPQLQVQMSDLAAKAQGHDGSTPLQDLSFSVEEVGPTLLRVTC